MKKKNLFLKTLPLFVAMTMVSCGGNGNSKGDSTPGGNSPIVSVPDTPSTPTPTPSTPTPSTPTPSVGEDVEHQSAFVSANDGAVTRKFNENYDKLITDFSAETEGNVKNHLRVLVDNACEGAPISEDASIYKMATGSYEIHNFDGIGFRMRKVGKGSLKLSNLVLGLRGDDAWDLHKIKLSEAMNPDGDALNELTEEYQEYVISPNLSLVDDDAVEYKLRGTENNSGTKVLDKILGFHFMAEGECSQVIEIEEVYLVKGADKTVLDSFNREEKNKADAAVCWWRDSTGFIVQKGQDVSKESYTADLTNYEEGNLVLNVMGDSSTATVGGVAWADLRDQNNEPIKPAVNGAYYALVINLSNSGITSKSVTIASEKELCISKVFVSDLQERDPVTVYPELDVANASIFDNFNRTQSGFDGDYDASSTNPVVTGAGLFYALSYSNGDKVTVADGHATFDATSLAASDYINFKEAAPAYSGQHYLVLSVKAIEGANYNDFRFNVGNGVTYVNQMVSAFGLKLPTPDAVDYPYTTADGYQWLIIDLAESGMTVSNEGFIDMYYSGTGKLLIDAIFYCDEVGRYPDYEETVIATFEDKTVVDYGYGGEVNSPDRLIKMEFTAEEGVTLESLRFAGSNGERWFSKGEVLDENGNPIDGTQELNGLIIIVDLEASGLDVGTVNHLHGGAAGLTGTYSVIIKSMHPIILKDYIETVIATFEDKTVVDYGYGGEVNSPDRLIKMEFTAEEGVTLESLRFAGSNGERWFSRGEVLDENGNPIDGTQELNGLIIIVDLEASGLDVGAVNHLHGGAAGLTGTYSVTIKSLHEKEVDYASIMSSFVQEKAPEEVVEE